MAIADPVTTQDTGRTFAQMVRDEQAALRLWARHHRDYLEFWLLTVPIDADTERRLYAAGVELRDRFPEVNIRVRILNPRFFEHDDLTELVPAGAEEIPLRPA